MNYALCIVLLVIAAMLLTNESQQWKAFDETGYLSYIETFEDIKKVPIEDLPSPADLFNNQPYHLLSDEFEKGESNVTSRSCYTSDFENVLSETGNFRQITNNYKRGYPDNCSTPFQELIGFYKAIPF